MYTNVYTAVYKTQVIVGEGSMDHYTFNSPTHYFQKGFSKLYKNVRFWARLLLIMRDENA